MESHNCKYEEDIGVIKATLLSIQNTLKDQRSWRAAMMALVGTILVTFIIQIAGFSYCYGRLTETVQNNKSTINSVLKKALGCIERLSLEKVKNGKGGS